MSDKTFTTADVGSHTNDEKGYWLIVEDGVYDVTSAFHSPSPAKHIQKGREKKAFS